jgi:V8-like Glu-specific endopeptidase
MLIFRTARRWTPGTGSEEKQQMLNERLRYVLPGASVGSVFCLLLLPGVAGAQQIVASPQQTTQRSAAYWTASRKAAAQPMPLRSASGTPVAAGISAVTVGRNPGSVGGNLPAGAAGNPALARVAHATVPADVAPALGTGSTTWYAYPPPSTLSIPILDYFTVPLYPNTAVGKLFFSGPGANYVCSAQSVTSAGAWGAGNRQTVITAGHCCSNGAGTFFGNWMFEPAHVNGSAPLGSWAAGGALVYTAWHEKADLSRDFCVLQMHPLNGQNINDAVGALGYAWNQPLPQSFTATGWPAAAPFTGGLLYHSFASSAETDTTQAGVFPFTHGIGNPMTGGSSGGAWVLKYQSYLAGNTNFFNGLNSYKYTTPNRSAEMFGPYVDADFINTLFQVVATMPALP